MAEQSWSEPERSLQQAAGLGTLLDLSSGDSALDDPAGGANWGDARLMHAELIVQLLTATGLSKRERPRAIRLKGARVVGDLDLEAATLVCSLVLISCHVEEPINLREAQGSAIRLPGCHINGVAADQLHVRGDLELKNLVTTKAEVRLLSAHIGGNLDLSGAALANTNGPAFNASSMTVEQSMDCTRNFRAQGEVNLLNAHIGGALELGGARLSNAGGYALNADGLEVDQDMFCKDGFTAEGVVRLPGAHIGGNLELDGATLTNPDAYALHADGLKVDQDMFCRNSFTAHGEVRLLGARIGGQLVFEGASLVNANGPALNADSLTAHQGMFCRKGFTAEGEVRLPLAHISGNLNFDGAKLTNVHGVALNGDSLTVDQSMFCREGFTAAGEVKLSGVRIGGTLDFSGATLANAEGRALDLKRASAVALNLLPETRPEGLVDLTNARVGSFDDKPECWPTVMRLRGFAYDVLENDLVDVRTRVTWLNRHEGGYAPGLYDQLAAAYRRAGRVEDARQAAIAKQRRRRRELNPLSRGWNWLLFLTVGYGYRPWLAGLWLIGLLAVGALFFASAHPTHMRSTAAVVPDFQPVVYTLDVLLPIVDFGQEKAWIPLDSARIWAWVLTGAGWILTTAVVAGLTNAVKRD